LEKNYRAGVVPAARAEGETGETVGVVGIARVTASADEGSETAGALVEDFFDFSDFSDLAFAPLFLSNPAFSILGQRCGAKQSGGCEKNSSHIFKWLYVPLPYI
jgi:hypothetical protein